MKNYEEKVEIFQKKEKYKIYPNWVRVDVSEVINLLFQSEFTITESMKFISVEYKIEWSEAKKLVENHPVWHKVVEQNITLQNEFWDAAQKIK